MAILLVEDEALIREIMAESLADDGFEVIQVATGDEALALIDHHDRAIEALVTDFHMPGEADGAEVAAHARIHYPQLPVIIASGRPDVIARTWDPELGYRFLGKPYLPRHLLAMLHEALHQA
ncbi:response regulator [Acidisoma cellulosilytica]|uniref:Response regulator n=1 Tax=Acidisoma cellulosilyticum TaxID=2802395 RepID=A0A964E1W8_9PROT|nr:response regulator [Acidisoma cellulosilyticum]MCB8878791.1 response regulator [Acidisoma cellulosilyticum]